MPFGPKKVETQKITRFIRLIDFFGFLVSVLLLLCCIEITKSPVVRINTVSYTEFIFRKNQTIYLKNHVIWRLSSQAAFYKIVNFSLRNITYPLALTEYATNKNFCI